MSDHKVPAQEVLEANREAALHFTLHDFKVLVGNLGVSAVIKAMDEETYWKLHTYFCSPNSGPY